MLQHLLSFAAASLMAASIVLLLAATASDVAFRRVPNWISAALTICGLILRADSGSLPGGLIAAMAVFTLAAFCWRRGWLGGGDFKLLAAATLTLPPLLTPTFLLAVALAGGALAVLYLILSVPLRSSAGKRMSGYSAAHRASLGRHNSVMQFFPRLLRVEQWRIRQRGSLPYAAAIAAGAFFVLIK